MFLFSKLDKDGKLMQTTIFGGKSLDEVTDMIATPDGGAVVLVYSTCGKSENLNNAETQNLLKIIILKVQIPKAKLQDLN